MEEQWGKYRLESLLARGGMAEVFKADMIGPSGFIKSVCLKRVRSEFCDDQDFVQMFEAEARIAATLQHPNIVQVFDFDRHAGQLFLAMEFVEGLDLRQIIKEATRLGLRLPLEFVIHVMTSLLSALEHAHELTLDGEPRPVIHRDISPHNILVSVDGNIKLADFGIAKARGLSDATRTGVVKGKLAYLSPEQAAGEIAGPMSDLYSAGLVMWEMLTGERMLKGDEREIVAKLIAAGPLPEQKGLSRSINQFMSRILAPDQNERFESAGVALDELRKLDITPCSTKNAGQLACEIRDQSAVRRLRLSSSSIIVDDISNSKTRPSSPVVKPRRFRKPLAIAAVLGSLLIGLAMAFSLFSQPSQVLANQVMKPQVQPKPQPQPPQPQPQPPQPRPQASSSPVVQLIPAKKDLDTGTVTEEATKEIAQVPQDIALENEPSEPTDIEEKKTRTTPKKQLVKPQNNKEQTGLLTILVRPWSNIKVDGASKGSSPLKDLKLAPGTHRVILYNDDFKYHSAFNVEIKAGKKTVIRRNIKPDR